MSKTTTPKIVTSEIIEFGKKVYNASELEYIVVQPDVNATYNNCFPNVDGVVETKGGVCILGWSIWKWRNILIEAEAHAIWLSPEGKKIDVTPHIGEENKILFLQDNSLKYDGNIIPSIRQPLSESKLVSDYIKLAERREKIMIESEGNTYSLPLNLIKEMTLLSDRFNSKASRNDDCPCGSGLKYKRCCGN